MFFDYVERVLGVLFFGVGLDLSFVDNIALAILCLCIEGGHRAEFKIV